MMDKAPLLYIIHATADRALAIFVKSQIEANVAGLPTFLASKPGDIPTGNPWLADIWKNLRAATKYLLLLTPSSVDRRWIWYEAGAAWRSDDRQLPVVAGGLNRDAIPFPLGAGQALELDNPEHAAQLFIDLGGSLQEPDEFCRVVRTLAVSLPDVLDAARIAQVREAFGSLGDGPARLILRRMLERGPLSLAEMATELAAHRFGDNPEYVERVRNALRNHNLVHGDADGRWAVKPELKETLRACFNPSLAQRMLNLAAAMRASVEGSDGLIDLNEFEQKFRVQLKLLAAEAEREHSQGDEWLSKLPSSAGGVRGIADALTRVATRVP